MEMIWSDVFKNETGFKSYEELYETFVQDSYPFACGDNAKEHTKQTLHRVSSTLVSTVPNRRTTVLKSLRSRIFRGSISEMEESSNLKHSLSTLPKETIKT